MRGEAGRGSGHRPSLLTPDASLYLFDDEHAVLTNKFKHGVHHLPILGRF